MEKETPLKSYLNNLLEQYQLKIDYIRPWLFYNQLEEALLQDNKNKTLDEVFNGETIETEYGETYKIETTEKLNFHLKEDTKAKENIITDLKLLPNIGPVREKKLKDEGYTTIHSLTEHTKFKYSAENFIETIQRSSISETITVVKKNYSGSHPKILDCASLADYDNFKFMDIETLGLSNVPVILIGVSELEKNKITTTQYLLKSSKDEQSILNSFINHITDESIFVTYNGASFDIPFIKQRFFFYQQRVPLNQCHLDLYHMSRRLWNNQLPNFQLTTVEKYLFNLKRTCDVPGEYIPHYYKSYLQDKNPGPLIPIIEHNRIDIVSLAKILKRMTLPP